MGIEGGSHEDDSLPSRARNYVERFLLNASVLSLENGEHQTRMYREYRVRDSLMFPKGKKYALTNKLENYQPVNEGEILAVGNGLPLRMPFTGHILFPPRGTEVTEKQEDYEICYFAEPETEIEI